MEELRVGQLVKLTDERYVGKIGEILYITRNGQYCDVKLSFTQRVSCFASDCVALPAADVEGWSMTLDEGSY